MKSRLATEVKKTLGRFHRTLKTLGWVFFNLRLNYHLANWAKGNFINPPPHIVKQSALLRLIPSDFQVIETGTYLAETSILLGKHVQKVFSIEPQESYFKLALSRYGNEHNISFIHGSSEEVLPDLLSELTGKVAFWLDGHFSEGQTFKGLKDTPIIEELRYIAANLHRFEKVIVAIDDLRCFHPEVSNYSDYPPVTFLIEWAEQNLLTWYFENDIFVAQN